MVAGDSGEAGGGSGSVGTLGVGSRLAKGISSLYLVQILSFPLSIATNLLAGRFLDPSDYGLFATALFVVSLVGMVSDASLTTVLIRHPRLLERKDYASVFSYQIVTALALSALLFAGASGFAAFFEDKNTSLISSMIRWLCLTPILSTFITVPLVLIERDLHYGRLAVFSMIWAIAERVALIVFMVWQCEGHSYVYSRIFGLALQIGSLYWITRWNPLGLLKVIFKEGWNGKEFLRFGWILQLKAACSPLGDGVIPAVGGKLFDAASVGLVAWSHSLAGMVGLRLPQLAGRVLTGAYGKIVSSSAKSGSAAAELRDYVEKTLLVSSVLVGTALAVLAATMPELLAYLFKPRWHGAAPYFTVACGVMGVAVLFTLYDALGVMLGRPGLTAVANWGWAVTLVIIGTGLALWLGPIGLLWGHFVATLVPIAILHVKLRRSCPLAVGRNFMLPMALALAWGFLTAFLKEGWVTGPGSLIGYGILMGFTGVCVQLAFQPALIKTAMGQFRAARAGLPN